MQHTWNILRDTTAGNVCQAVYLDLFHERQYRFDVDASRREQSFGRRCAIDLRVAGSIEYLANQRIAIRVRSAGGDSNDDVTLGDGAAIDHFPALDRADCETREVILAGRIHVRHFSGLATHQGSAGLQAALRDSRDDVAGDFVVELATGEIVEEEQRFRTLDQHVIDAHGNEIDTDRVVNAQVLCQHELGSDAVCSGDENRLVVTAGWEGE